MQIQISQEINVIVPWINQLYLSINCFLAFLGTYPDLWLFQITQIALNYRSYSLLIDWHFLLKALHRIRQWENFRMKEMISFETVSYYCHLDGFVLNAEFDMPKAWAEG